MMLFMAAAMLVGVSRSIDSSGGASFSTDSASEYSNDGIGCSWVCNHLGSCTEGAPAP